MAEPHIGFIGVGLMGHGAAKHIRRKGYALTVMGHRNRAPVEDLVAQGAMEATTPAALARDCQVVITCVTSSKIMEQLVFGDDGLMSIPGENRILVDMTTAEPTSTLKIYEALTGHGWRMLDAPMTRTPKEAEEGRLNLIVGGEAELLAEVRPILETYSENIFHAGPIGAGHKLKLINNFLSLGHAALAAEAAATATRVGVDIQTLFDVVSVGGANSVMFQLLMRYPLQGDDTGLQFTLTNARKDYGYYMDMTRAAGTTPTVGAAVYQSLSLADALGHGGEFVPHLLDVFKNLNGD